MTQPVGNRGLNDACNHGKEESSGFPPFESHGIVPYLWLFSVLAHVQSGIICQVILPLGAEDDKYVGLSQPLNQFCKLG